MIVSFEIIHSNTHEKKLNIISLVYSLQFTSEDLEAKDPRGRTPLLLAVTLGHLEMVKLLLDAGADVNCEKDGWTGKVKIY